MFVPAQGQPGHTNDERARSWPMTRRCGTGSGTATSPAVSGEHGPEPEVSMGGEVG